MAKTLHIRLPHRTATHVRRLAKSASWSFNKAAEKLVEHGARTHPNLKRK